MKRRMLLFFVTAIICLLAANLRVGAHCQIPCGIYDDHLRVEMMLEDARTVAKCVNEIKKLAAKTDPQSKNQLVRWVANKEKHAQNIISVICDYFLTQRVKTAQKDYTERLKKHHAVILAAVKCKQHVDPKNVDALKKAVKALEPYYPDNHTHKNK